MFPKTVLRLKLLVALRLAMNDLVARRSEGELSSSRCDEGVGVGSIRFVTFLFLSGLGETLTVIAAARSLIASGRSSLAGDEEGNGVKVNWVCLRRLDRVVTISGFAKEVNVGVESTAPSTEPCRRCRNGWVVECKGGTLEG